MGIADEMSQAGPPGGLGALLGSIFSSLAVRDYRLLFFGNLAFQTSIWMQQLVFGWLLLDLGGSPFWLGMGGFVTGVAMIVMSPISGTLADAFERRRVLMASQGAVVLVNGGVALLLWLGRLDVWHLLAASLVMGLCFTMNMPARASLTAELVGRRLLPNATAVHATSLNISRIAGPAIGGTLLGAVGPLQVLLLNLVANCWTVIQLARIRYRPPGRETKLHFRGSELLEGFRFCWRERRLLAILLAVSMASFFGMACIQLLPAYARDVLGVGPEGLGALMASLGGGALVGSLALARWSEVSNKQALLCTAGLLLGVLLVGLGFARSLPLAVLILALTGVSTTLITPLGIASLQELVPDHLSGRVLGVYMLTMGLMPLGALPAGALADLQGTGAAIRTFGLICTLGSAALLLTAREDVGLRSRVPEHVS